MGYSSGMMRYRVAIMRPKLEAENFGGERGYEYACTVWASEHFNKGQKALREGALDAYDRVMFRMRWNEELTRFCMLVWEGRTYQIESLNGDKMENEMQVTAVEVPGKDLAGLVPGYSTSELGESREGEI